MILSFKKRQKVFSSKNKKIIFTLIFIVFLILSNFTIKDKLKVFFDENIVIRTHIKSLGIAGVDRNTNLVYIFKNFLINSINYFSQVEEIKTLIIDINFKNFDKLNSLRKIAIENGQINKANLQNVKGKLKIGEKKYKANIRLKGYHLDHIATDKWSLKFKLKNDNIEGIRDFSIMNPATRDFHSSILINEVMKYRGIIAPRNKFYKVILNGKNLGVMLFEERFTEQLTEYFNTPHGPIIYYDEKFGIHTFHDDDMFWNKDKNLEFFFQNIVNFENHPEKYINYIDQNSWAEYLAINFLFKCHHGNIRMNLSYYFHPLKKTIQPISSDNSCGSIDYSRKLNFLPYEHELIYKLIKISSFKKLLKQKLNWWLNDENAKIYINKINQKEKLLRSTLSKESIFLGKFFIDNNHLEKVIDWINHIQNTEDKVVERENIARKTVIPMIKIEKKNGNKDYFFEINDYSSERYLLKKLIISTSNGKESINLDEINDFSVISKNFNELLNQKDLLKIRINKVELIFFDLKEKIYNKIKCNLSYEQKEMEVYKFSLETDLRKFFKLNKRDNLFFLEPNKTVIIDQTLVFPPKYDLLIQEGSTLKFHNETGLIINGGLTIKGRDNKQVNFTNYKDAKWAGVLILAEGKKVHIDNLIVNGGNGKINDIQYRGTFTINDAKIKIENSIFQNNQSEDSLNLVQVNGDLKNITIQNTQSDGLDIDYSTILISKSNFENIGKTTGADAIDFSKSNVKMKNININNVTDKGISIGENSFSEISNLKVSSATIGVAVKDSSNLIGKDIIFKKIRFVDAMAYRKKPHFTGGNIELINLNSTLNKFILQNGSSMTINNNKIKEKKIDIDLLYKTIMLSEK